MHAIEHTEEFVVIARVDNSAKMHYNIMRVSFQEAKEVEVDAAEDGYLSTSRAAVLADAEALLTCYGVGEESGAELLHAVVELCFTSSVRFLQPGLLLKVRWNPCSRSACLIKVMTCSATYRQAVGDQCMVEGIRLICGA